MSQLFIRGGGRLRGEVTVQGVEAEEHVYRSAVPVRDMQRLERAAVGNNLAAQGARAQGELVNRPAVGQNAEGCLIFHTGNPLQAGDGGLLYVQAGQETV